MVLKSMEMWAPQTFRKRRKKQKIVKESEMNETINRKKKKIENGSWSVHPL